LLDDEKRQAGISAFSWRMTRRIGSGFNNALGWLASKHVALNITY